MARWQWKFYYKNLPDKLNELNIFTKTLPGT